MDAWELAGTIERAQDRRDEKWLAAIEYLLSRADEDGRIRSRGAGAAEAADGREVMASRETVGMVQDAARQAVVRKLELLEAQAEELLAEDRAGKLTARTFWDRLKKRAGIE